MIIKIDKHLEFNPRKNSRKFASLAISCIMLLSLVVSCQNGSVAKGDSSLNSTVKLSGPVGQEPITITIKGVPSGDITISSLDLLDMEQTTVQAKTIDSKNKETIKNVQGVLLDKILEKSGSKVKDFESAVFSANDGYSVAIPKEILQNRQILLSTVMDGEAELPRTVVPDERTMYWVKDVTTIEFIKTTNSVETQTILFFDTMKSTLSTVDYKEVDEKYKAIRIPDILSKYITQTPEFVQISSTDKLQKDMKFIDIKDAFIRYTGEDTPWMGSAEMPRGMTTKLLMYLKIGKSSIFSLESAMPSTTTKTIGTTKGADINAIFALAGLVDAGKYTFLAADGYKIEIKKDDLAKGVLFLTPEGTVSTLFEGLAKETSIKNLISITAEK